MARLYLKRDASGQIEELALSETGGAPLEWTSVRRRPVVRALLDTLVAQLTASSGDALGSLEVAERIWPDEMMAPEALTNRLYNVVSQLKRLGFKDVLRSSREGYWLDPSLEVHDFDAITCPV